MKRILATASAATLAAGALLGLTACGPSASNLSGVKALGGDGLGECPWADSDPSQEARYEQSSMNAQNRTLPDTDDARKCGAARAKALGYTVLSDKQAAKFGLPATDITFVGELEYRPLYVSVSKEPTPACIIPLGISTDHGDFGLMIDHSMAPDTEDPNASWVPLVGLDIPASQVQLRQRWNAC